MQLINVHNEAAGKFRNLSKSHSIMHLSLAYPVNLKYLRSVQPMTMSLKLAAQIWLLFGLLSTFAHASTGPLVVGLIFPMVAMRTLEATN